MASTTTVETVKTSKRVTVKPEAIIDGMMCVIRSMVEFPNATVCRHYVALTILGELEKLGIPPDPALVAALAENSNGDEAALKILKAMARR